MKKLLMLFLLGIMLVSCGNKNTKHNVFFEAYGYVDNPATIYEVSKLPELPELQKDGYKFVGWYYDSSYNKEAEANQTLTGDVVLYAKWEKLKTTFDVFFDALNVTTNPASLNDVKKIEKLPQLSCEGYVFEGWYYDQDYTKVAKVDDTLTSDITLYAKWSEKVESGSFDTPIIPGK